MKFRRMIVCCAVFVLVLLLGACNKELTKIKEGDIIIDLTEKFDPISVLYDIKEGSEITYVLDQENSILFITLINGDKKEVLEIPIIIKEPQYEIAERIVIDRKKGFNARSFVRTEEGVSIDCEIDETTKIIKIILKKGMWTKHLEKEFIYINETDDGYSSDNYFDGNIASENELQTITDGNDNEYYSNKQPDDVNNEENEYENEYDTDNKNDNELPLIVDD